MDLTKIHLQLVLVVGTIALLIPGMNVVATNGNADASKITNGSCYGSPICLEGSRKISWEPEVLDFGPVIIGQIIVKNIRVRSYDRLFDISKVLQSEASSLHVQLKPKTLNSDLFVFKIRVALVPNLIGAYAGVITVFTSSGRMQIPIQAEVAPSPFRIAPIEHPRIPKGSSFLRDIVIYNPYRNTLQITQIYLSGGPFHLTVPENADKPLNKQIIPTDRNTWDIPSLQSRAVASITVDSSRAFREKSFLRIKFNSTVFEDVIVPVNVTVLEVSENMGFYSVDGVIDFGFVRLHSEAPSIPMQLRLSKPFLSKRIDEISDIAAVPAVTSTMVQRSVSEAGVTVVAHLSFFANSSVKSGLIRGEILVRSGHERLLVPYRAYVADGNISVTNNSSTWLMNLPPQNCSTATIEIRNDFPVPVVIVEASVIGNAGYSDSELINVNFPIIIPPRSTAAAVAIKTSVKSRVAHTLKVALMTNMGSGVTEIAVRLYTGELRIDASGVNHWFYNGMLLNSNETGIIMLRNINPANIAVHRTELISDCLQLKMMWLCDSDLNCSVGHADFFETVIMPSNSFLNLSVMGTRSKREGACQSVLRVTTSFEVLVMQLKIHLLPGRLELYEQPIIVEDLFPSCFTQRNITVFNSFDKQIDIMNIFSDEFPRLKMDPPLDGVEVSPQMGLVFDTLTFDGRELCKELPGLCYVGFSLETTNEKTETWKRPFRMVTHSSVEIDRRMKERQLAVWNSLSEGNSSFQIATTVKVTTKQAYLFHLPVVLNFVWPPPLISARHEDSLEFPLLSVGNFSEMDVEVTNPSDATLFVHAYVFRDDKAASWNRDIFSVKSIVPKGTTAGFYKVDDVSLPEILRLPRPSRGSAASVVPYGGQFLVRIVFQPQSEACYRAVLHIRNNLTVVESIPIRGCGVEPNIRFSNEGTVPESSTLLMKFSLKDGAYCRNRTIDVADRSKIRRTGRVTITNTVGAYITVESVSIVEDDWYHRSFALSKAISPFLLAPNKTRKLRVEFNPDFEKSKKTGKLLVFVSDRVEPFVFEMTGEVDLSAMQLCGEIFGRSENDIWIRYLVFRSTWGWILYYLPLLFFAAYIFFIRHWYIKRLKSQFLRRYLEQLEQRLSKKIDQDVPIGLDKYSQKFLDQTAGESRRRGAKRKGTRQEETVDEMVELTNLVQLQMEHPLAWHESVDQQIPENLRELFCVAYFAEVPFTFFKNFKFPTRRLYRVFVLLELSAFPVRLVITLGVYIVSVLSRLCGWPRSTYSFNSKIDASGVNVGPKNIGVDGAAGSFDWKKLLSIFPVCTPATVVRVTSKNEIGNEGKSPQRNGLSKESPNKSSSTSPPVATVAPVKRVSISKRQNSAVSAATLAAQLVSPATMSRDSSCAGNSEGESDDEHELGRCSPAGDESRSARKLRRKQMHQAKLMAEKAAKLAKTYNKTQRKAEEKKATEAKTEQILVGDKTSVEPSSDSDVERVQRIEAAKRRAKLEADKQLKKLARPTASAAIVLERHGGHKSPDIFVPIQIRPSTYPVQTEFIQQAFFKVEPKQNGLMFTEMNRDECFQLVKQLKRDHPNLFQLDPKVSVELLQQITRSNRYRVNGEYVDLARKSSVVAYAGSIRAPKKENNMPEQDARPRNSTPYSDWLSQPVAQQALSRQRSNDQRSPDSNWSFSPTGSENGTLDNRLSPMLSYADVAGQQSLPARKSVDISQQRQSESSEPWKPSGSPAVPLVTSPASLESARFLWDDPSSAGTFVDGTFKITEFPENTSMLSDYQRRQCNLVDYGDEAAGAFRRNDRSLFFSSQSHELESYLADLDKKNHFSPENVLPAAAVSSTVWPDNLSSSAAGNRDSWQDEEPLGWPFLSAKDISLPGASAWTSDTGSHSSRTPWGDKVWSTSTLTENEACDRIQEPTFFGVIGESSFTNRRTDKF